MWVSFYPGTLSPAGQREFFCAGLLVHSFTTPSLVPVMQNSIGEASFMGQHRVASEFNHVPPPPLYAPPGLPAQQQPAPPKTPAGTPIHVPMTAAHTPLEATRRTPPPQQPQYLSPLFRCYDSPNVEVASMSRALDPPSDTEADSPIIKTLHPEPRRVFLPFLDGPGSPSAGPPPSPDPPGNELCELLGFGKASEPSLLDYRRSFMDTSRPLSSISAPSTSAGPTPGLDDTGTSLQLGILEGYRAASASPFSATTTEELSRPGSRQWRSDLESWPSKDSSWEWDGAASMPYWDGDGLVAPTEAMLWAPPVVSPAASGPHSLARGAAVADDNRAELTAVAAATAAWEAAVPLPPPPPPPPPPGVMAAVVAREQVVAQTREATEALAIQTQGRQPAPFSDVAPPVVSPEPKKGRRGRRGGGGGGKAAEEVARVVGRRSSGAAAAAATAAEKSARREGDTQQLTKARVVQMSKTQAGSKLLQRKLLKGHPTVIKEVLDGLETELPSIMCDMYGNYLCSAAFQACSVAQRQRMLDRVSGEIAVVAVDQWGTHALQALISLICTSAEEELLTRSLQNHVVSLSCDPNGVHVVQRTLVGFGPPFLDMVLREVLSNLSVMAHNPHSLCILKKCISSSKSGTRHEECLQCLSQQAVELAQGPYGNYAVQHALEEWGGDACEPIIQALIGKVAHLSIQKFSSNAVEQMLRLAAPALRRKLLEELTSPDQMSILMSTVYGHYVARRALQTAEPDQKALVERAIASSLSETRNRRLRARWERILRGETADEHGEAEGFAAAQPAAACTVVAAAAATQAAAGVGSTERGAAVAWPPSGIV